ncbi:cyclin-like protein, partial [Lentinus brumalis]
AVAHSKRWIVDRATLRQARSDDVLYLDDPDLLRFLNIFFANLISKLGKKLSLRQRVIATATVFFRRFYVKNSYCETDPFIVIAACCYVAAKAEESPVHIKNVVSEARMLFGEEYGIKSFPSDNSKLAEMEFYLVDELECDLTVFHPYRTLMTLCGKEGGGSLPAAEAGEADADDTDGPRYWGTGEGKLELQEGALQMAWFIINDTYRSELCLLYPPHLIAIAAIYLTLVFHAPTRAAIQHAQAQAQPHASTSTSASHSHSHSHGQSHSPTRRSSRSAKKPHPQAHAQPQDIVGFMAGLNVSMPLVATVAQEIIALYALWDRYSEDPGVESARAALLQRTRKGRAGRAEAQVQEAEGATAAATGAVTPMFLVQVLLGMREQRMADMAHPASGRPVVVNKMLERTQAAG